MQTRLGGEFSTCGIYTLSFIRPVDKSPESIWTKRKHTTVSRKIVY